MKLEVRGRKIFKENPKPKIPKLYTDVGAKYSYVHLSDLL